MSFFSSNNSNSGRTRLPVGGADPLAPAPTQGRRRPPDAPIVGRAIPRPQPGSTIGDPGAVPSLDAGGALGSARSAAEQMRKRARAGSLQVTLPTGATSTRAVLRPRTLTGV
jgi:hypothetical protein